MIRWILIALGSLALLLVVFVAYLILPPITLAPSTEAIPDRRHDTQVVVQWRFDDASFEKPGQPVIVNVVRLMLSTKRLFDLEDTLETEANGAYWDSGNDIGSGTFNVYLYAADPDRAVNRVIAVYKAGKLIPGMRIGVAHYKNAARTDWDYRLIYPTSGGTFELMDLPVPVSRVPRTRPSKGNAPRKTG